jgi:protein-S-isoprenylcysteine O-methyltransferase Ste14
MFPIWPIPFVDALAPRLTPLWSISPLIWLGGLVCLWATRYTHQLAPRLGSIFYVGAAIIRLVGVGLVTIGWLAVFSPPIDGSWPQVALYEPTPAIRAVGYVGALLGSGLGVWSIARLGVRQSLLYRHLSDVLITDGPYALVRHPQFLSAIVVCFFGCVVYPYGFALVNLGIFSLALWTLSILEERELVAHFGQAYRDYAARVPRLFPN